MHIEDPKTGKVKMFLQVGKFYRVKEGRRYSSGCKHVTHDSNYEFDGFDRAIHKGEIVLVLERVGALAGYRPPSSLYKVLYMETIGYIGIQDNRPELVPL